MKKGVVLLLTLFFMTAISALILKNLSDTDIFLEEQNYIMNNTQVLIAIKNTKNEVGKLIKKYKDSIDEALENELLQQNFSININDLNITFSLKKYNRTNINKISVENSKVVQDLFLANNIFDYELFKEIYLSKLQNTNKKIETRKQLDDIINTYIIRNNNDILNIKDELGFISSEDLYELNINTKYSSSEANAYYLLKNDGMVQYFDISFK